MWYMSALNTFHFAVLVHVLQSTDLVMMQHLFTGMTTAFGDGMMY
jgi:hypothetical protein